MTTLAALFRAFAIGLLGLLFLVVLWVAFWSFYNPFVDVPAPLKKSFPSVRGDETGRVLFLGDFAPTDRALPYLEKHGYGYPYSKTLALLASHDAVLANLEAPITTAGRPWPLPKKYTYKIHPDAVPAMRSAGIDVVTLANNHSHDYGRRGLHDTLRNLDGGGIAHIGAGMSEAAARRGIVIETSGGRLGVLSYMQDQLQWRVWTGAFAMDAPFRNWSGSARLDYSDLLEDIKRLRSASDVVAVVVHWGSNYKPVNDRQRAIGRACIDFGADVVIGHHPHQYQPVAMHRGRPIVYSVGNYAFGTIGNSKMRFGMAAALHLRDGRVRGIEFTPLLTQNRIVKYRVRAARGEYLRSFMRDFIEESGAEGATVEERNEVAWLELERQLE